MRLQLAAAALLLLAATIPADAAGVEPEAHVATAICTDVTDPLNPRVQVGDCGPGASAGPGGPDDPGDG